MNLDDDELPIAALALRVALKTLEKAAEEQLPDTFTACAEYCEFEFAALLGRIEQHQKDQAEEKADGA